MASKLSLFLAELKRRKVTRVAVVYILVGLGAIEAVDIIGSRLLFPEWAIQFVIVLVLIGFPIALVLAWALEVTPAGIQRTPDLTPDQLASQTPERWSASSWVLAGVGLVIVLAAGYFVFFRGGDEQVLPEEALAETLPEDYVAVFPFRNLTGDSEWDDWSSFAAHVITGGIGRAPEVRPVASTTVEQALEAFDESGPELEVARSLGAGIAVSGAFRLLGGRLQITADITQTATGELVSSVDASGDAVDPEGVINDLRQQVLGALAVSVEEDSSLWGFSGQTNYEAFRSYKRGIEAFVTGDFESALAHYVDAFRQDSTFLAAAADIGEAFSDLGDWVKLDSLLLTMRPRLGEMSNSVRLRFEGLDARLKGDLDGVLQAQRALFRDDPPTYAYQRGWAAVQAGRPEEALQAFEFADPDSPMLRDWPALWSFLARAYYMAGRFQEELEIARDGQVRFPEYGGVRWFEIQALIAMDRLDEIEPLLQHVERMEPGAGAFRWDPGGILRRTAVELAHSGYAMEARTVADRALSWYLARDPDAYQRSRAQVLLLADKHEEALALLTPLVLENPENLTNHGLLGITLALTGDQQGAEAEARWCEELDRPYLHGADTFWRAAILAHLDRKDETVRLLRQALQEGVLYQDRFPNPNFKPLWGYEPFEQLVAPEG